MNPKGKILNVAFAVSAAFVFATTWALPPATMPR